MSAAVVTLANRSADGTRRLHYPIVARREFDDLATKVGPHKLVVNCI